MNKQIARKKRGARTKIIIANSKRPRLVVFRSAAHIYAQIIVPGDKGDTVLVSASTKDKEIRSTLEGNKVEKAIQIGKAIAKKAIEQQISQVAFDRAGYLYHGRVKALAEAAREAGLEF